MSQEQFADRLRSVLHQLRAIRTGDLRDAA